MIKQKTEVRSQKTEVGRHVGWVERSETHLSFPEDSGQKSEDRRQKTLDTKDKKNESIPFN